jgi:hypothetical protein
MSNLIENLPINKFYNPTPVEINVINSLLPENKNLTIKQRLLISFISSSLICIVLYFLLSKTCNIDTKSAGIFYITCLLINYISTEDKLLRLLSSFL